MSKHLAKHVAKSSKESTRAAKQEVSREEQAERGVPRKTISAESYESSRTGKKKKSRGHKVLVTIIIILAVLVILAELAYLAFGHFYSKMNITTAGTAASREQLIEQFRSRIGAGDTEEEEEIVPEDAIVISEEEAGDIQSKILDQLAAAGGNKMSDKDVVNILLIGTDARTLDEHARSDVMMLVSLNKKAERIILTSFMRDIYTYIPDYGYNRLNAPYAIAGADYLIDTLEADFGIQIDNYAAVNFYAFADVIDAVNGIDLQLTDAEVDFINGQTYWGEQANLNVGTGEAWLDYSLDGWYHLNGTQALAHCRNRSSAGSDFDRTGRQRIVISAMIEKAKTLSLTELYNLLNTVLPMVSTDMSQGACLSLLLKSADYLGYEVESIRVPGDSYSNAMIDGMAVLSIDFEQYSQLLKDTIYG